jgi:hypothetical protein
MYYLFYPSNGLAENTKPFVESSSLSTLTKILLKEDFFESPLKGIIYEPSRSTPRPKRKGLHAH